MLTDLRCRQIFLMQTDVRSDMSCTITPETLTLNLQITPGIMQFFIFFLTTFRTWFQGSRKFILQKYWLRWELLLNMEKNLNIHSYKLRKMQTIRKQILRMPHCAGCLKISRLFFIQSIVWDLSHQDKTSLFIPVEHRETAFGNQVCTVIPLYITIVISCLWCDFSILSHHSSKSKSHITSNIFK